MCHDLFPVKAHCYGHTGGRRQTSRIIYAVSVFILITQSGAEQRTIEANRQNTQIPLPYGRFPAVGFGGIFHGLLLLTFFIHGVLRYGCTI